jgi:hypothetical protein
MVNRDRLKVQRTSDKTFTLVDKPAQQTALNRQPDGGTLWPSGRLVLNANGSDLWHEVVRVTKGIDPDHYLAKGGGIEERMLIGVYAVVPGTPGGTGVRLTPRKGATAFSDVILHLRNVFETYPSLRPTGKRKVSISCDWDSQGKPYLEVDLQSQLSTKTTPRKTTSDDKKPEPDAKGKTTRKSRKQPEPQELQLAEPHLEDEDELALEEEEE